MKERSQPMVEQSVRQLNIDVNTLLFRKRQQLMRELKDLQAQLARQVCVVDDGLMTIKGERVQIEANSDGTFSIRGIEFVQTKHAGAVDYQAPRPKHKTKKAAMDFIKQTARDNGLTIVEE